ncbi:hypothetical protein NQ318_005805 [Aromia moschata]|uniref:Uncharacterized protein n=1 Tax=Aromia moschata TaxID=1265417 RepID=A0AAV8YRM2_9CUCU|nr:hypothetical protein NQ318_005805 [Aromia moschata]
MNKEGDGAAKKTKKDANGTRNGQDRRTVKMIEVRKEEILAIRSRFPSKIPIMVQRYHRESHLPQLDKSRYLVPQDLAMSQFLSVIRNRINLNPNQALYLLVNNRSMMSLSLTLGQVYAEHANTEDGYLYITYASQETFGGAPQGFKDVKYRKSSIVSNQVEL